MKFPLPSIGASNRETIAFSVITSFLQTIAWTDDCDMERLPVKHVPCADNKWIKTTEYFG